MCHLLVGNGHIKGRHSPAYQWGKSINKTIKKRLGISQTYKWTVSRFVYLWFWSFNALRVRKDWIRTVDVWVTDQQSWHSSIAKKCLQIYRRGAHFKEFVIEYLFVPLKQLHYFTISLLYEISQLFNWPWTYLHCTYIVLSYKHMSQQLAVNINSHYLPRYS